MEAVIRGRGEALLRTLAVIALLYWARSFFVAIALSLVLALALNPIVKGLRHLRLPGAAAIGIAVLLCVVLLGGSGALITVQVRRMAVKLPEYKEPIFRSLRRLGPVGGALEDAYTRFEQSLSTRPTTTPTPSADVPSLSADGPLTTLTNAALTLLSTIGIFVIILVLLSFFLANLDDLRDRLLGLFNARGIPLTPSCLSEAGGRVSRYVLTEIGVNTAYGAVAGAGAWVLGVPEAFFWGLLAGIFRFIPYVGVWLVAAMAAILSWATSGSTVHPLSLLAFWFVLELATADALEPWLYGRRTGMTSIGVMISALFWSWLWGIPGLVIATPLTAALVELGTEVPALDWLNRLCRSGDDDRIRP